jgi:uncharacterized membrane protein
MSDSPQYTPVPPQAPPAGQPQAAQSGLTDAQAGALAYVTIIPAIIFLLVEPYNKNSFVRFHAWQCIFLYLVGFVIGFVNVIPLLGQIVFLVAMIGLFVVWLMALLRALKGERWEIPIIGKYAAQQAGS